MKLLCDKITYCNSFCFTFVVNITKHYAGDS